LALGPLKAQLMRLLSSSQHWLEESCSATTGGYRKHIERDAALERRFQPVMVGEPSVEDSEILYGLTATSSTTN